MNLSAMTAAVLFALGPSVRDLNEEALDRYQDGAYGDAHEKLFELLGVIPHDDPLRHNVLFSLADVTGKLMLPCDSVWFANEFIVGVQKNDASFADTKDRQKQEARVPKARELMEEEQSACEMAGTAISLRPRRFVQVHPKSEKGGHRAAPLLGPPAGTVSTPRDFEKLRSGGSEGDYPETNTELHPRQLRDLSVAPTSTTRREPAFRWGAGVSAVAVIIAGGAGLGLSRQANANARSATSKGVLEAEVLKGKIEEGVGWSLLSIGILIGIYASTPPTGGAQE